MFISKLCIKVETNVFLYVAKLRFAINITGILYGCWLTSAVQGREGSN